MASKLLFFCKKIECNTLYISEGGKIAPKIQEDLKMRKLKLISLMLILALSMQVSVFATNSLESTAQDNTTKSVTVQPRGRYLQSGGCTITPHKGYVTVSGHTDAYYDATELTVTITILKEISPGNWLAIWSDSATEYNTYHAAYPNKNVTVQSGYNYMIEATHTVKHNGLTETTHSEAGVAYVY